MLISKIVLDILKIYIATHVYTHVKNVFLQLNVHLVNMTPDIYMILVV